MLAKLFGPRPSCPVAYPKVDLSSLEQGLASLQSTAADVTRAAANAAKMLEEEHLRTKACFMALNSASDAICILDHSGHIYFCNDQFLTNNSISHYNDVVGVHILKILPQIPNFDQVWESCRSNHTEVIQCPNSNIKLTIVPMMNGAPKPIYYACTFKVGKDNT